MTRKVCALLVLAAAIVCAVLWGGRNATEARIDDRSPQAVVVGKSPLDLIRAGIQPGSQQVSPEEYYHQVWKLIDENFLYRNRLTNWSSWEHKYKGKLKTFTDAERAINQMLDSLHEPYTYFKNKNLTSATSTRANRKNVVTHQMLSGNIGYIRIKTFSSTHTADELEAALKALSGADAYIIDLRWNGGGYLNQAFKVFSLLNDSGKFTSLKGHYAGKPYVEDYVLTAKALENIENGTTTRSARMANLTANKPLVVLVNNSSASASEMLAAALQDNGRAEIIGTRTYGKGIAQITFSLPRSTSVKMTFARFYSPNGSTIHGQGVTPDTSVNSSSGSDSQLNSALASIKKKLGK